MSLENPEGQEEYWLSPGSRALLKCSLFYFLEGPPEITSREKRDPHHKKVLANCGLFDDMELDADTEDECRDIARKTQAVLHEELKGLMREYSTKVPISGVRPGSVSSTEQRIFEETFRECLLALTRRRIRRSVSNRERLNALDTTELGHDFLFWLAQPSREPYPGYLSDFLAYMHAGNLPHHNSWRTTLSTRLRFLGNSLGASLSSQTGVSVKEERSRTSRLSSLFGGRPGNRLSQAAVTANTVQTSSSRATAYDTGNQSSPPVPGSASDQSEFSAIGDGQP
ncbi:hypothetical protein NliqN6_5448 [Naganishia liquefaciens]|uniref:Uncharacterized protein n=1 Tax=Naganishia liquefaciens TaxID=104408 RepID=A0A8H3TY42_9TREE|nr:hypothetical protein NliqN6_5448 [Naganishia liquefaciens]